MALRIMARLRDRRRQTRPVCSTSGKRRAFATGPPRMRWSKFPSPRGIRTRALHVRKSRPWYARSAADGALPIQTYTLAIADNILFVCLPDDTDIAGAIMA